MQNIPSHAGDIREMFRATPERISNVPIDVSAEGELSIQLPHTYSILRNGEYVRMTDINVDDLIMLTAGRKSQLCVVSSVQRLVGDIKLELRKVQL